jgi:hypothetical protein
MIALIKRIQNALRHEEIKEAAKFSTEQKFIGWLLLSRNPEKEWETLKRIDDCKLSVFGRRTMGVIRPIMEQGRGSNLEFMKAFGLIEKEWIYWIWLSKALEASSCFVRDNPLKSELKEVGIL